MNIEKVVKDFGKAAKEAGEAMSDFAKLQKEWYQKSFWFRCWVRWDNLVFSLKQFFKKTIPLFVGYVIFKIKHPKLKFVTWREK